MNDWLMGEPIPNYVLDVCLVFVIDQSGGPDVCGDKPATFCLCCENPVCLPHLDGDGVCTSCHEWEVPDA